MLVPRNKLNLPDRPLTQSMIEALSNLVDGEMKHGAHVLPGRSGHARLAPLGVLRDRGLIDQIRAPHAWDSAKVVYWTITDAGRTAFRELNR